MTMLMGVGHFGETGVHGFTPRYNALHVTLNNWWFERNVQSPVVVLRLYSDCDFSRKRGTKRK